MVRLLVTFIHVCAAMGVFGASAIEGALLVWSFFTRLGILIGIVFLMTLKPPLQSALIAVAAAAGAGFLAGRPARRRRATRVV